jgi:predicted site-specific integrase-resolvase
MGLKLSQWKNRRKKELNEEMVEDLISIMTSFSADYMDEEVQRK